MKTPLTRLVYRKLLEFDYHTSREARTLPEILVPIKSDRPVTTIGAKRSKICLLWKIESVLSFTYYSAQTEAITLDGQPMFPNELRHTMQGGRANILDNVSP